MHTESPLPEASVAFFDGTIFCFGSVLHTHSCIKKHLEVPMPAILVPYGAIVSNLGDYHYAGGIEEVDG